MADPARKLARKDADACWATKGDQTFYNYKHPVKVGAKTKVIRDYIATPASTNDGSEIPVLITTANRDVRLHADDVYTGAPIAEHLRGAGTRNYIHAEGVTGSASLAQLRGQQRIGPDRRADGGRVSGAWNGTASLRRWARPVACAPSLRLRR